MSDSKMDLAVMMNYKGWLDAIANNAKNDLGKKWLWRFEERLKPAIGILEWMIEECKDIIAEEEVEI